MKERKGGPFYETLCRNKIQQCINMMTQCNVTKNAQSQILL